MLVVVVGGGCWWWLVVVVGGCWWQYLLDQQPYMNIKHDKVKKMLNLTSFETFWKWWANSSIEVLRKVFE